MIICWTSSDLSLVEKNRKPTKWSCSFFFSVSFLCVCIPPILFPCLWDRDELTLPLKRCWRCLNRVHWKPQYYANLALEMVLLKTVCQHLMFGWLMSPMQGCEFKLVESDECSGHLNSQKGLILLKWGCSRPSTKAPSPECLCCRSHSLLQVHKLTSCARLLLKFCICCGETF